MNEKTASMICYFFPPFSSIAMMFLADKKNKDIQFHVWQGTAIGIAALICFAVFAILIRIFQHLMPLMAELISYLPYLVLFGFIGIDAYNIYTVSQGEKWKMPYMGEFAEQKASQPNPTP